MTGNWMIGATAAVLFGGLPAAANALPAGDAGDMKLAARQGSYVEKTASCWSSNGAFCVEPGENAYSRGYRHLQQPEDYRFGSRRWWRSMDREGGGGFK